MKRLFNIFLVLFFVVSFLLMSKALLLDSYPDFRSYYFNPVISYGGENPYLPDKNLFTPSVYHPFIFVFFYPLSFLPFSVAEKLWVLLSIFALLASLFVLFKICSKKVISLENLALSSLVFLSFPVKFTLGMGQINIFILLLICLFVYYLNKSPYKASFYLGLSLLLKIFPIFIFLYLIIKRKWKILFLTSVVILIGLFLTFVFVKDETNLYFYQKILPTLLDSWKGDYYNQSLSGLITRSINDIDQRRLIKNVLSIVLLAIAFIPIILNKLKDKHAQKLELSIVLTANLILNSFSWQHHFVWIILPLMFTYFFIKEKYVNKNIAYVILFISYCLISLNLKAPQNFPLIIQSHVFFGAIILLFLDIYLLRNYKK